MSRQLPWVVVGALIAGCSSPEREPKSAQPARSLAPTAPTPAAPTKPDSPRVIARVTAAGLPVAGATVQLSEGRGAMRRTAITDREGRVHIADLEPGAYELWAESGELASQIARTAHPDA